MKSKPHYRAVFTSDWHLGFKHAHPKKILAFLKSFTCDFLYLDGDIFDFWAMAVRSYWDNDCNEVVRYLFKMTHRGTKIFLSPGNHDENIRQFLPLNLGDITVADRFIHTAADGRKYLVLHGDIFDFVVRAYAKVAKLGSWAYDRLLDINPLVTRIRAFFGYCSHWSFSQYMKMKAKSAGGFITDFMLAAISEAVKEEVDGIICGHIHRADLTYKDGVMYGNCGDFVESFSALAEKESGLIVRLSFAEDDIVEL
jgi:UDP-2,3-diacylglucosamine pyrophosphatase LpxH